MTSLVDHPLIVSAIGPSSLLQVTQNLNISVEDYEKRMRTTAQILARWPVTLAVNADCETAWSLAQSFTDSQGSALRIFHCSLLESSGSPMLPVEFIQLIPRDIPFHLVHSADVVICLGFGTGTLLEICLAKFESRATVLILREFVSCPLPQECNFDRLAYIDTATDLYRALSRIFGEPPASMRMSQAPVSHRG